MYFHNVAGTGSYTTSSTNVYNKDQTYTAFRRREHVFQTVQCQRWWHRQWLVLGVERYRSSEVATAAAAAEKMARVAAAEGGVEVEAGKIDKRVSIDHTRNCIQT